jgi:hypothetical protein
MEVEGVQTVPELAVDEVDDTQNYLIDDGL